jgi:hypothetical protein
MLATFLVDSLDTNSLLFMVQYADTSRLDVVAAAGFDLGRNVAQYPCAEAIDFPEVPYTDHPSFAVGPEDAALEADGIAFTIFDLYAEGVIADDGESVSDVVVTGLLDTRALSEVLGSDLCGLAAEFGDDCVACPDGEVVCLAMEIQDPSAPWREDVWIDAAIDPEADPICR